MVERDYPVFRECGPNGRFSRHRSLSIPCKQLGKWWEYSSVYHPQDFGRNVGNYHHQVRSILNLILLFHMHIRWQSTAKLVTKPAHIDLASRRRWGRSALKALFSWPSNFFTRRKNHFTMYMLVQIFFLRPCLIQSCSRLWWRMEMRSFCLPLEFFFLKRDRF